MGALRPRALAALVGGARHAHGRRGASDAAVPGPGRLPGHRGIEDAATLARLLRDADASAIPERLARYEALRKPRATQVQQGSFENATTYHLPDGPAQEARDARYVALAREAPYAARGWLFDHDAEAEIA